MEPGMTQVMGDVCSDLVPVIPMKERSEKPVIVITSGAITKANLFQNGLLQNILLFYKLFQAIGCHTVLMMNEIPPANELPDCLVGAHIEDGGSLARKCLRVHTFIEVGMSIDTTAKKHLKMMGAKLIKIYLGNILNIDIETSLFSPNVDFPHHIGSGSDMILVSPHYGQNMEYAQALNHVPLTSGPAIAPYVWDSSVLGSVAPWRPSVDGKETIVILEPNISFQKSCIVPLLALERWYRRNRGWQGKVALFNSERPMASFHFQLQYFKRFTLFRDGKIELHGRREIRDVLAMFPSATFFAHQVNNEFNYMMLELFSAGYPVIHNVNSWREFGYFYSGADLDTAASQLRYVKEHHAQLLETYRSHAALLSWRYSPYNPTIQKAWKELLQV